MAALAAFLMLVTVPAAAAEGVAAWNPAPHGPGQWSALIDPIVWLIAFLARHRFLMMPVLAIALPIFIGWRCAKAVLAGRRTGRHRLLMAFCVLFGILNVIFGPWRAGSPLSSRFIRRRHRYCEPRHIQHLQ